MKGDTTIDRFGAMLIQGQPDVLVIWTVYHDTSDYPGEFVARPSITGQATYRVVLRAKTLDEIRKVLPPGLHCLTRHETDDPKIMETWL